MIKIAVIDDGISVRKIKALDFNIEIDDNCETIGNNNTVGDNSHGTICAMIIKKYAPDATLGSIKILKTYTKRGYVNQFRKALEWCIQHGISLINISLGSVQSYDYSVLHECVKNAYHNGIIIVAAFCNRHVVTYPASFQNVIGVETDPLLRDDMYFMKHSCIGIDVVASSVHTIENKRTDPYNSYAAPLITAKVYQIMNEFAYRDIENIKITLNDRSYQKLKGYDPSYCSKVLFHNTENKRINPIEIPCIMIRAENIDDRFPCFLNDKFNQAGYSTLFIQSYESDAAEISHHVIVEELSDNTLAYITSKYEADLIIISFDDTNSMIANVACDILFYQEFEDSIIPDSLNSFLINRNISSELKVGYKSESNPVEYIYRKTIELLV